ncbi:cellulose binding domain-containing protein [Catellatospora vulcania]|uniref:cellulose binding domain-containing protein n=1 Tax=Catellatospora vulcania TaxID=1460450 RepID=UPI0018AF7AFB|nr:cellulose binding domain-containing protein [Catellatospora vulcania]
MADNLRSHPARRPAARLLTLLVLAAAAAAVPSSPAGAVPTCTVRHQVTVNWGTGYQAQVTVSPGAAVTSWTAEFDLPDPAQVLTFAAYAWPVQSGRHVTLANASFNGTVPAGGSVTVLIGVQTNPNLTNTPPAAFTVNGQPCAYTPQPYVIASPARPTVPEGGTATFAVRLSQAPAAVVTVPVGGATNPAMSASPAALVFTPANWAVPQTVTVTSPQDADTTGQTGQLNLTVAGAQPVPWVNAVVISQQLDDD